MNFGRSVIKRLLRGGFPAVVVFLSACGGGSGAGPTPAVVDTGVSESAVAASVGGQAQSSDKKLTLAIPADALPADTTIRIEKIASDELGSNFDGIDIQAAYRFGPAGTQFAEPVQLTLKLDKVAVDQGNITVDMPAVVLDSDGELTGLENVVYQLDADTGEVTLTADVPHFSVLAVTDTAPSSSQARSPITLSRMTVGGIPDEVFAYEPFSFDVELEEVALEIDGERNPEITFIGGYGHGSDNKHGHTADIYTWAPIPPEYLDEPETPSYSLITENLVTDGFSILKTPKEKTEVSLKAYCANKTRGDRENSIGALQIEGVLVYKNEDISEGMEKIITRLIETRPDGDAAVLKITKNH